MDKIKIPEIVTMDYDKIHKEAFIDVTKDLKHPPTALSIGETTIGQTRYSVPFGTYGNFSCLVGQSKSKKTFLKSLLTATYIGGDASNYANDFKSHRATEKYILDIDTEQGEWHAQRASKRVLTLCGGTYPNYKPFYLRKYDHKERLEFIEWLILESQYSKDLGLVCLDGIADLVSDVNDLEQANNLTQKLLMWSEVAKCHILTVLHKNYGSSKPTGHLGSSTLKKAETVCLLEVDETEKEYVNVEFPYTRSFNIEPFRFSINQQGLPEVDDNKILF